MKNRPTFASWLRALADPASPPVLGFGPGFLPGEEALVGLVDARLRGRRAPKAVMRTAMRAALVACGADDPTLPALAPPRPHLVVTVDGRPIAAGDVAVSPERGIGSTLLRPVVGDWPPAVWRGRRFVVRFDDGVEVGVRVGNVDVVGTLTLHDDDGRTAALRSLGPDRWVGRLPDDGEPRWLRAVLAVATVMQPPVEGLGRITVVPGTDPAHDYAPSISVPPEGLTAFDAALARLADDPSPVLRLWVHGVRLQLREAQAQRQGLRLHVPVWVPLAFDSASAAAATPGDLPDGADRATLVRLARQAFERLVREGRLRRVDVAVGGCVLARGYVPSGRVLAVFADPGLFRHLGRTPVLRVQVRMTVGPHRSAPEPAHLGIGWSTRRTPAYPERIDVLHLTGPESIPTILPFLVDAEVVYVPPPFDQTLRPLLPGRSVIGATAVDPRADVLRRLAEGVDGVVTVPEEHGP